MKFLRILNLTLWKSLAIFFIALGMIAAIERYSMGLGATTHLMDTFPWGIWIGFDILVGVGLAAGGFAIAATVYLFNIERFRPILRPTVLTAFLGYILVIAGLMADLGRPWAIWHAIIMWNPHSVMFEVAWCVMLYTTVLALEFSPVVFERFNLQRPLKIVHAITIPLVILGVVPLDASSIVARLAVLDYSGADASSLVFGHYSISLFHIVRRCRVINDNIRIFSFQPGHSEKK